ncbi:MAG: O-antigen ligase family protein [Oscillospiraceae bacterium]|nr:O-antigen ligase family protein [Oscillospiraceae bacterium]
MAKNLLNTSDKTNFIVNLNMDKYRAVCVRFLLAILWMTGIAQAINELTYSSMPQIDILTREGGFGAVLGYILLSLRSVSTVFTFIGVLALIWMLIGVVRLQFPKSNLPLYGILTGTLVWGVVSLCHSFDTQYALMGMPQRDEGMLTLLLYAVIFYLGTMARRGENRTKLFGGLLIFGIAQIVWGFLQAQPFFPFPSSYRRVEPLSLEDLRLPSGFTDSPVTYAMLLMMLIGVAVPNAFRSEKKSHRILAVICASGSIVMSFKTQTVAGLIAGFGGLVLTAICFFLFRKNASGRKWLMPAAALAAACLSVTWVYFSPSLNRTIDRTTDQQIENGFRLCDGGIIWDDASFRIWTAGAYVPSQPHDFEIKDSCSVLRFCWSEGIRVIGKYPALGAGPDNFQYTQLHSSMEISANPNTIDRPYNDFLYIGATRGIPAMLLHIVLIAWCLVLAWKRRKTESGWQCAAAAGAALLYCITAMVGISVLTVAPMFWMLLGAAAAEPVAEPVKRTAAKKPKAKPASA